MSNVVSVTMVLVFHGDDVGNDKPVIFRCLHGPERTKINSRCHHEITILSTPRQLFKIVFFFNDIYIGFAFIQGVTLSECFCSVWILCVNLAGANNPTRRKRH